MYIVSVAYIKFGSLINIIDRMYLSGNVNILGMNKLFINQNKVPYNVTQFILLHCLTNEVKKLFIGLPIISKSHSNGVCYKE